MSFRVTMKASLWISETLNTTIGPNLANLFKSDSDGAPKGQTLPIC
jgi:hypothetical protein